MLVRLKIVTKHADRQVVFAFSSGSSEYAPACGEITGTVQTVGDEMPVDLREEVAVATNEELRAAKRNDDNALTQMTEERHTHIDDRGVNTQRASRNFDVIAQSWRLT